MAHMVTDLDIDIAGNMWECTECGASKKSQSHPAQSVCLECKNVTSWRPERADEYREILENAEIGKKLIVSTRGTGTFKGTVTEFEDDVVILDQGPDRIGIDPKTLQLRGYGYHGDPVGHVQRIS